MQSEAEATLWQLSILGTTVLRRQQQMRSGLERKQAGLLALLALEGEQTRSKIAGWLWADSSEATARNNLSQTLKRIRNFTEKTIIVGENNLQLINTTVDALLLETNIFMGEYSQAASSQGLLLEGYDFSDCPDFADWLALKREYFWQEGIKAATLESARLEQAGELNQALEWAENALKRDNVAENSYRRIMKLQYLLGQRSAALKTFTLCSEILARELGVAPSKETLHLKSQIESHELPQIAPQKPELPLSVLRPKHLIGRETAWAAMHQAWAENKAIFISGSPGMGKTRLVQDFLSLFGEYTDFSSRPGDLNLPYAFFARTCKNLLSQYKPEMPDWVRLELSRVIPDLRQATDSLKPLESAADQLRFFQAAAENTRLAHEKGMRCIVVDDLQYIDNASFEISQFVMQQHWGTQNGVQNIVSYRTGTLPPEIQAGLEQAIAANLAVLIELEPLNTKQTQALIESLELDIDLEPSAVQTYTNGNPLYMLESIRYCLETGNELQHAPRIKQLITQRLENLPAKTMQLAQIAAIMNQDFTIERGGKIFEQDAFALADILEQLEQTQVMQGEVFIHDLIFEAVISSINPSIKRHLHRQIAHVLEQANLGDAGAMRIADHYINGGENNKALGFLEKAAVFSSSQYRLKETADLYIKKARIEVEFSDNNAAFQSFEQAYDNLTLLGLSDTLVEVMQALVNCALTPIQHASALIAKSTVLVWQGTYQEAIKAALAGLTQANLTNSVSLQAKLENTVGTAYWHHHQLDLAVPYLERSLALNKSLIPEVKTSADALSFQQDLAVSMQSIAICHDQLGNYQIAAQYHLDSITIFKTINHQIFLYKALGNYSTNLRDQGNYQQAYNIQFEADSLVVNNKELHTSAAHHRISFAKVQTVLGMYAPALNTAKSALALAEEFSLKVVPIALARVIGCLRHLGQFTEAQNQIQAATLKQLSFGHHLLLEQCYLELWQGLLQPTTLQKLEQQDFQALPRDQRLQSQLLLCAIYKPHEALEQALKTITEAKEKQLQSFNFAAHAQAAAALLALGRNSKALEYSRLATQIPDGMSSETPFAEILLIHYQVLSANQTANALKPLHQALTLIKSQHKALPLEYQESFLTNNPINKAILEAAKANNLDLKNLT